MNRLKLCAVLSLCGFSMLAIAKEDTSPVTHLRQYISDRYRFSLSYPMTYAAGTEFSTAYFLTNSWSSLSPESTNNSLQDSVWQVELQNTEGTSKGNAKYYYKAFVRVGVSSDAEDIAFCEKNNNDGSVSKIMMIGGQPFVASTFAEAGMSQFKSGVTYRRLHDNKCYSIEYIETGSSTNDIPKYAELSKKNQSIAKKIVDSFVFTDGSSGMALDIPSLTAKGIGGLNAKTIFDLKEIHLLFPEFDVKKESLSTEGEAFDVIAVSQGQEKLFTVFHKFDVPNSKKVLCVSTNSSRVKNEEEVKIGDTYQSIYKGKAKCMPGIEEMSGRVICQAPNTSNLYYTFKGTWDGPDGTIPPKAVLKDYQVVEVIWLASTKDDMGLNQYCHG